MDGNKTEILGKFLAYVLRHKPQSIGILLDAHGWTDTDGLIAAMNKAGQTIDALTLEQIVAEDAKMRFSLSADKRKIRANQGHSVPVDPDLKETVPPEVLYHGTAEKYLDGIKQSGIQKRTRNFVHLSADEQTAVTVGARHGKPVVLQIDARKMHRDGYKFYLSENGVWLTDTVPLQYVLFPQA